MKVVTKIIQIIICVMVATFLYNTIMFIYGYTQPTVGGQTSIPFTLNIFIILIATLIAWIMIKLGMTKKEVQK
jgi:hypothetical protein